MKILKKIMVQKIKSQVMIIMKNKKNTQIKDKNKIKNNNYKEKF